MADIFNVEPSTLFCDENKDLCFDDLDVHEKTKPPLIIFPDEENDFSTLVVKENDFLPKHDFLYRLRCGELDLTSRKQAFDWIFKVHAHYSFGPLSLCLAVNYLDRFLSICDLPEKDKSWGVQLLAVACLSIAAKMEETFVPQSIELQVGDPKFVFEAKTIQRMELLVLDTLSWRMNAVTPCSFLECSIKKLSGDRDGDSSSSITAFVEVMNRSMQLVLCIIRGIDFLEFKPSEIAAAIAIYVSTETRALDIDHSIACFVHLEKVRVLKCVEMIKGLGQAQKVPQSPNGVLESLGFSYKSDELTNISCYPETKRKKLNTTTSNSGL